MIEKQLSLFFNQYLQAFAQLSIPQVRTCYQLPCTLSSPDNVILLADENSFTNEFSNIYTMLKTEHINGFKASNMMFDKINEQTYVVSIDWQFLTETNNLFAEFKAIYHLTFEQQRFKIFNVISQDIGQKISLSQAFTLTEE